MQINKQNFILTVNLQSYLIPYIKSQDLPMIKMLLYLATKLAL